MCLASQSGLPHVVILCFFVDTVDPSFLVRATEIALVQEYASNGDLFEKIDKDSLDIASARRYYSHLVCTVYFIHGS